MFALHLHAQMHTHARTSSQKRADCQLRQEAECIQSGLLGAPETWHCGSSHFLSLPSTVCACVNVRVCACTSNTSSHSTTVHHTTCWARKSRHHWHHTEQVATPGRRGNQDHKVIQLNERLCNHPSISWPQKNTDANTDFYHQVLCFERLLLSHLNHKIKIK